MKTITITKEVTAPPDGWQYNARRPEIREEFVGLLNGDERWRQVELWSHSHELWRFQAFAYRIRDEYAERYEALKLPDGFAWFETIDDSVMWSSKDSNIRVTDSFRRIVNGKAYKPGQEPK
jgi:hypothetical protein